MSNAEDIVHAWVAIREVIHRDHELAWVVHCHIASSFLHEGGSHEAANRAAARVMRSIFECDSEQLPQWKAFPWASKATTDTKEGDDE